MFGENLFFWLGISSCIIHGLPYFLLHDSFIDDEDNLLHDQ